MMNERIKTLIRLFWQGKLSAEGRKKLLSELTNKEVELRATMEDEFGELQDDKLLHREGDYQIYLENILDRVAQEKVVQRPVRRTWQRWAAAASVLFIFGLAYLIWPARPPADNFASSRKEVHSYQLKRISNDGDGKKMIAFKDGSKIILYPGSSIDYKDDYGQRNRYLILKGEAKFTVARDTLRPFVVEAKGYTTTALGTSFIIDARSTHTVNVTLLTGRVVVHSLPVALYPIAEQHLLPGEKLQIQTDRMTLQKASKRNERAPVETRSTLERPKESKRNLHFQDESLMEVLKNISVIKKVKFHLEGLNIQGLYFTGDFSAEDDLETILNVIALINGLDYEIQPDRSVRFYQKNKEEQ